MAECIKDRLRVNQIGICRSAVDQIKYREMLVQQRGRLRQVPQFRLVCRRHRRCRAAVAVRA